MVSLSLITFVSDLKVNPRLMEMALNILLIKEKTAMACNKIKEEKWKQNIDKSCTTCLFVKQSIV